MKKKLKYNEKKNLNTKIKHYIINTKFTEKLID